MLDFTKFIEFINSNGFQTILLFVAGLSIFILYKLQKNDKRKNVATMIVLEIDEIKKNIDVLKLCFNNGFLNDTMMFESSNLIENYSWNKHKNLLIKKLGVYFYSNLEKFFDYAELLALQQKNIKNFQMQNLYQIGIFYKQNQINGIGNTYLYNSIPRDNLVNRLNELNKDYMEFVKSALLKSYIPQQFVSSFSNSYNELLAVQIEGVYLELKKIAKIKK